MASTYTGRFAPSPTGPLHFGSLVAALASYLDAKANSGRWLVRIEDLDPPREIVGASALILRQLEQHGLCWDGEVVYQSARTELYQQALEQLLKQGKAYPCECSRQQVKAMGRIYNGHCFSRDTLGYEGNAIRLRLSVNTSVDFDDYLQGPQQQNLSGDVGDFVIHRRDGLFAYQLAVTVDDAAQGITHVIRGKDLLDSTPRQIHLFNVLDKTVPRYGHLPIAHNASGQKLSKQNKALSLARHPPEKNLCHALAWLGLTEESTLQKASIDTLLNRAIERWDRSLVPVAGAIPAPSGY